MKESKTTHPDRLMLLQTWVRIVESGSLTAAARLLNTTQPTVSRRLRALESLFGSKLLLRTTHQIKLTDDGEACYQYAKQMLSNWAAMEESVGKQQSRVTGKLRIRAPHAFGQGQLIAPLIDYLRHYPDIRLDWQLNDTTPDFLTDNIDCAIQVGTVSDTSVVARLVTHVPRILVASPQLLEQHPEIRDIGQIADLPWISVSTFYRYELTLKPLARQQAHTLQLDPIVSTDNIYAATQLVSDGLGIAVISSWLVQPLIESGKLVQVLPDWQADELPVYLVYPYANYYPKRLTAFLDIMTAAIKQMSGTRLQPASEGEI